MFKNFCIERPKQRRLVPILDLGIVLKALQLSPFEPLDLISFKFLTYKCCFLLALATGRRRSELHALSVSESCIRFAAVKSSVTFLTDPAFLAKNQLSEKGSGIIVIPALPNSGPTNLCPVRTLLKYLDTAFGVRSKDSNRLFVPIKQGQNDITAKAISSWICSTVMLAYKSAGITLPRNQVKAHEVRAIASSWSIFNSASLTEILSAGFLRSDNTFYYHYLRFMPLVSAQKVIFPPTS
jgi:integrase